MVRKKREMIPEKKVVMRFWNWRERRSLALVYTGNILCLPKKVFKDGDHVPWVSSEGHLGRSIFNIEGNVPLWVCGQVVFHSALFFGFPRSGCMSVSVNRDPLRATCCLWPHSLLTLSLLPCIPPQAYWLPISAPWLLSQCWLSACVCLCFWPHIPYFLSVYQISFCK